MLSIGTKDRRDKPLLETGPLHDQQVEDYVYYYQYKDIECICIIQSYIVVHTPYKNKYKYIRL